jgi:hypothetical protein
MGGMRGTDEITALETGLLGVIEDSRTSAESGWETKGVASQLMMGARGTAARDEVGTACMATWMAATTIRGTSGRVPTGDPSMALVQAKLVKIEISPTDLVETGFV